MDRIVWAFVWVNTILGIGHHVDHYFRHRYGWPLRPQFTPWTMGLIIYVAVGIGVYLTLRGKAGPGYWSIISLIGFLFIGLSHYGPLAEDRPMQFVIDYGSQAKATAALVWLWLFLISLAVSGAYAANRWAMLRRAKLAPQPSVA